MPRLWPSTTVLFLLVALFAAREARAQMPPAEQLAQIGEYCRVHAGESKCQEMFALCLGGYDSGDAQLIELCNRVGMTPAHALERLDSACEAPEHALACGAIRNQCKITGVAECPSVAAVVCPASGCPMRSLCTPQNMQRACVLTEVVNFFSGSFRYGKVMDPENVDGISHLGLFTMTTRRLKTLMGSLGISSGADMTLGVAYGDDRARFAYELDILVGGGFRLGDRFVGGAQIGAGFSGMKSGLDFTWEFPLELYGMLNLGRWQILGLIQPQWVTEDDREHGSEMLGDLLGLDELDVTVTALLLGGQAEPGGPFAGLGIDVTLRELQGTRAFLIGLSVLTFGY